jgi:hypothetical protein
MLIKHNENADCDFVCTFVLGVVYHSYNDICKSEAKVKIRKKVDLMNEASGKENHI